MGTRCLVHVLILSPNTLMQWRGDHVKLHNLLRSTIHGQGEGEEPAVFLTLMRGRYCGLVLCETAVWETVIHHKSLIGNVSTRLEHRWRTTASREG
jgi:hypothetical protein